MKKFILFTLFISILLSFLPVAYGQPSLSGTLSETFDKGTPSASVKLNTYTDGNGWKSAWYSNSAYNVAIADNVITDGSKAIFPASAVLNDANLYRQTDFVNFSDNMDYYMSYSFKADKITYTSTPQMMIMMISSNANNSTRLGFSKITVPGTSNTVFGFQLGGFARLDGTAGGVYIADASGNPKNIDNIAGKNVVVKLRLQNRKVGTTASLYGYMKYYIEGEAEPNEWQLKGVRTDVAANWTTFTGFGMQFYTRATQNNLYFNYVKFEKYLNIKEIDDLIANVKNDYTLDSYNNLETAINAMSTGYAKTQFLLELPSVLQDVTQQEELTDKIDAKFDSIILPITYDNYDDASTKLDQISQWTMDVKSVSQKTAYENRIKELLATASDVYVSKTRESFTNVSSGGVTFVHNVMGNPDYESLIKTSMKLTSILGVGESKTLVMGDVTLGIVENSGKNIIFAQIVGSHPVNLGVAELNRDYTVISKVYLDGKVGFLLQDSNAYNFDYVISNSALSTAISTVGGDIDISSVVKEQYRKDFTLSIDNKLSAAFTLSATASYDELKAEIDELQPLVNEMMSCNAKLVAQAKLAYLTEIALRKLEIINYGLANEVVTRFEADMTLSKWNIANEAVANLTFRTTLADKKLLTDRIDTVKAVIDSKVPIIVFVGIELEESGTLKCNYTKTDAYENFSKVSYSWSVGSDVVKTGNTFNYNSNYEGKSIICTVTVENTAGLISPPMSSRAYSIPKTDGGSSGRGSGSGFVAPIKTPVPTITLPDPSTIEKTPFTDIYKHWSKPYIDELYIKKVIKGKSENSFEPDASITRAEYITLVSKAFGFTVGQKELEFSDVSQSDWYYDAVEICATNKLISGSGGLFRPNDYITREEAAVILIKAYELKKMLVLAESELSFLDVTSIANWSYSAVSKAVAKGFISGNDRNEFLPLNNLTRAESSKIIALGVK